MSDDVLLQLVSRVQEQDSRIHHEILGFGSIVKLHKPRQQEDPSSLLSFSTPIFLIVQELKESGNLNLVTLTYNEEVLETCSLGLQEILKEEQVSRVVDTLNQPYRMCTGVEEGKVSEQKLEMLLVERVRSNIVYRSRDCRRVIKDCGKREDGDEEVGFHELRQLCSNCYGISNHGVKKEEKGLDSLFTSEEMDVLPEIPDFDIDGVQDIKIKRVRKRGRIKEKEKKFPCSQDSCTRSFHRELTRDRHIAENHSGELSVSCPSEGCKRKFRELRGRKMLVHISRLHPRDPLCNNWLQDAANLRCKTCSEMIGSYVDLQEHEKNCRQEATCELCGQVCVSSSSLKVHKRNVHSDEGFVCDQPGCGKKVKTKASLLDHISSVHKNQKLYVCHGCGKDFRYRHQRRMCENKHQGKFIHPCALCDKKFNDKRRFDQHMRTHTGEKPFVCPICSFRCSRMDNLNLHTKKSHGLTWKEAEGMTGISCKNKQISLNLEEEGAGLYGRTPDLNNTLPVHHINLLIQPKPEPFSIISSEPLSTQ